MGWMIGKQVLDFWQQNKFSSFVSAHRPALGSPNFQSMHVKGFLLGGKVLKA